MSARGCARRLGCIETTLYTCNPEAMDGVVN